MQSIEVSLDSFDLKYARLRTRGRIEEKRLFLSLEETGQQSPVIAVRARESGRCIVIDGHKRIRALKKLKADVAKAIVWDMPEDKALAAWHRMSRSGSLNAFEEGWLIAELHRTWKWDLGSIARELGRSKSWCSKRLALVEELPEWMAQEVAQGKIGAHAAASYLVPLTRVNAQDGKVITEKIRDLGLTNREIGLICQSYRTAAAGVRKNIVADPALFLKAQSAASQGPQDPALSEPANRVLKNLDLIGNVSLGLVRLWPQVMSYDTLEEARDKLWNSWNKNRKRFGLLEEAAAMTPPKITNSEEVLRHA